MNEEIQNIFFIHKCGQYWWSNEGGDNLAEHAYITFGNSDYIVIHACSCIFHFSYTPNQCTILKVYVYGWSWWKMGPRRSIFIEILNGLCSWWSNRLKMRNWQSILPLPLHSATQSGCQIEDIDWLILLLKFGVLKRSIHKDIKQVVLAARFWAKNRVKNAEYMSISHLPLLPSTHLRCHLEATVNLILSMLQNMRGVQYLSRYRWYICMIYFCAEFLI